MPVRRSRAIYPAQRVGLSSGTCARFTGTRTRGTPQFSLDGLLIPEGTTSHDYSPVRRAGPVALSTTNLVKYLQALFGPLVLCQSQ